VVSLPSSGWRPGRRSLAIALFVSVVLNLFLGGLILGQIYHVDIWPWQRPYTREFGPFAGRAVERLVRELDGADRRTVLEILRAHKEELAGLAKAMHEQREKVEALLRAPEFDRKAAQDAFAELRKRGNDMQTAMGAAILDAIEKLPPEARERLAQ